MVEGKIVVNNRKNSELCIELYHMGFSVFPKKKKGVEVVVAENTEEAEDNEDGDEFGTSGVKASDYDYLLSMSIKTLTREKVEQLCAEKKNLDNEVEELRGSTGSSLWIKDLDAFENEYTVRNLLIIFQ